MRPPALVIYIRRVVQLRLNIASDEEVSDKRPKIICTIATSALSLIVGIALLFVDVFGYGQATKNFSENLVFQLFAPFYSSHRQRDITVLLLDDAGLEKLDVEWPVKYEEHAEILNNVIDMRPAAVMVDILFLDNRDADQNRISPLMNAFSHSSSARVPVFLASTSVDPETNPVLEAFPIDARRDGSSPTYRPLHDDVLFASVRWENCSRSRFYYPLYFLNSDTDFDTDHDECLGFEDAQEAGYDFEKSPAMALYEHLCSSDWKFKCFDLNPGQEVYRQPMYVFWGTRPPRLNVYQSNRGFFCEEYENYVDYFISRITTGFDDNHHRHCPPITTILVRDFDDPEFRNLPEVMKAIRDNVVFYGVSLTGVEDFIETPNHGRVPGVYFHAAALDNLLELDRHYQKSETTVFFGLIKLDQLLQIIMLVLIVAVSLLTVLWSERANTLWIEKHWPLFTLFLTAGAFAFTGSSAVIQVTLFNQIPVNFLGISLVTPLSPIMLRFLCRETGEVLQRQGQQ